MLHGAFGLPLPTCARSDTALAGKRGNEFFSWPGRPRNALIRLDSRKETEENGRKWKGLWGLVWLQSAPSRTCVASLETPDTTGAGDALPGASVVAPEPASALGVSLRSGQALRDDRRSSPRLRALLGREALGKEAAWLGSHGRLQMAPQAIEKARFAPGNGGRPSGLARRLIGRGPLSQRQERLGS